MIMKEAEEEAGEEAVEEGEMIVPANQTASKGVQVHGVKHKAGAPMVQRIRQAALFVGRLLHSPQLQPP